MINQLPSFQQALQALRVRKKQPAPMRVLAAACRFLGRLLFLFIFNSRLEQGRDSGSLGPWQQPRLRASRLCGAPHCTDQGSAQRGLSAVRDQPSTSFATSPTSRIEDSFWLTSFSSRLGEEVVFFVRSSSHVALLAPASLHSSCRSSPCRREGCGDADACPECRELGHPTKTSPNRKLNLKTSPNKNSNCEHSRHSEAFVAVTTWLKGAVRKGHLGVVACGRRHDTGDRGAQLHGELRVSGRAGA